MTNEEIAREIAKTHCEHYIGYYLGVDADSFKECKASAIKMAEWKDEQPISELEGWHTEPPTKDGFYLVETPDFPKNCFFIIAEWDNDAKCFYDEATDNPIEFIKWKLVELT